MVAFNFRPEFAPAIQLGTKQQTIRPQRRCSPGAVMHLFTGLRTKDVVRLGVRTCAIVDYVHLGPEGLTLGDVRKHPRDVDEFAQLDGFPTFQAMLSWFQQAHGYPNFIGTVHRWHAETAP